jgi:nickel transport protein
MPGRIRFLSRLALVFAPLAVLFTVGDAHAHRLDAQIFARPNREIQVESWFSSGDAAKGARAQVFDAHDQLIAEGQLNEQGIFVFSYGDTDPWRIVISAGGGHRKELTISPTDLARAAAANATPNDPQTHSIRDSPAVVPLAERDTRAPLKDVLIGVSFLLALAAFLLSIRNAQKLRLLGQQSERRSL